MPPERLQALVDRTPIGRLVTMAEVVGASRFLLENEAINGINLVVDGGWMCIPDKKVANCANPIRGGLDPPTRRP